MEHMDTPNYVLSQADVMIFLQSKVVLALVHKMFSKNLTWKYKAFVGQISVAWSHIFCVHRAVSSVELTARGLPNISANLQAFISGGLVAKWDNSNVLIFSRPVIAPSIHPA